MSDKEREDGILFNSMDTTNVRKKFGEWFILAQRRYINFILLEVPVVVPEVCSDGVVRSPEEYILFTSGKTIDEHIEAIRNLNNILFQFTVEIVYTGSSYHVMPAYVKKE